MTKSDANQPPLGARIIDFQIYRVIVALFWAKVENMANPDIETYQGRYWKLLEQLKFDTIYLNLYYEESEKWDNIVSITIAITSSGSIAGWFIWAHLSIAWAVIIGIGQFLNVIGPHLPFKKRIRHILPGQSELSYLFLEAEDGLFNVLEGQWTPEEIHEETIRLKQRRLDSQTAHLGNINLPLNSKFKNIADMETEEYLTRNYQ